MNVSIESLDYAIYLVETLEDKNKYRELRYALAEIVAFKNKMLDADNDQDRVKASKEIPERVTLVLDHAAEFIETYQEIIRLLKE